MEKMIKCSIAENIYIEVNKKLDEIFNDRKEKEGLYSLHNQKIRSLKRAIDIWLKNDMKNDMKIRNLLNETPDEHVTPNG